MEIFLGVLIGIVIGVLFSFFGVAIFSGVARIVNASIVGAEFIAKHRKKWKEK